MRGFAILPIAGLIAGAGMEPAAADCTCRAFGRNFELGTSVCLSTPQGSRLATCGMVLNNTSWDVSSTSCVAARPAATPRGSAALPARARHGS
jgi:hypothetical protein